MALVSPVYTIQDEKFALLHRAAAGDEWAQADFYRQYVRLTLSWITGSVSPEDVEEIVSTAWAKFFQAMTPRKLASFRSFNQVIGYLHQCVTHTLYDVLRRMKKRSEKVDCVPVENWYEELADKQDDFSGNPNYLQLLTMIRGLLTSEREQLLFTLRFVLRWSAKDIVQKYPKQFCSDNAVYDALSAMRDRLRRNQTLRSIYEEMGCVA